MPKAVEVFTPNDVPTFSYVERKHHNFETRLKDALTVPKMIISLSGPSKSGKTVLVKKVIEKDNLIPLSGATIRTSDELWDKVLDWMEVPSSRIAARGTKYSGEGSISGGGKIGIPFVAHGNAEAGAKIGAETSSSVETMFARRGLAQVIEEIADSSFAVFVDDFHYIPKDVQKEIGKQIKEATEARVRIVTASVPHRADDVVRSNPELRGRVTAIDLSYWTSDELEQIAYRGFQEMRMDIAPPIIRQLTEESFGSPQLTQAIGLNFCLDAGIRESLPKQERIDMDFVAIQNVLERTSVQSDFSSMTDVLHAGPRQRGTERKEFSFIDGTKGDVYRCVLLAIKADPPRLSFRYEDMLDRTKSVCSGDSPVGSSVNQSLVQMDALAKTVQEAPVIEWDEDVLDIVEPYFLFYLRNSAYLQKLSRK